MTIPGAHTAHPLADPLVLPEPPPGFATPGPAPGPAPGCPDTSPGDRHSASPRLVVFVAGKPAPQGSKKAFHHKQSGKIVQMESSKAVKPWREDIRQAMLTERTEIGLALGGPLVVHIRFVLPRPKSHYRTGRNDHLLRDTAPTLPTGKPDVDKLARAVLDAIGSADVWGDDSQVVDLHATKTYQRLGEKPGAWITVEPDPLTEAGMTNCAYGQTGSAT